MTVYLVTTGVSLGWSRCWRPRDGNDRDIAKWDAFKSLSQILDQPEGGRILGAIHELNASVLQALNGPSDRVGERALEVARERFRWACWDPHNRRTHNHLLPAELATVNLLADQLGPNDVLRIACGADPRDGTGNSREAALVWAVLQQAINLGRLAARVELLKPVTWAPTDDRSFARGMRDLWTQALLDTDRSNLRFLLTGGYKAVVLDVMKEIVASGVPTTVYYLYEGQTGLVRVVIDGARGGTFFEDYQ